MYSARQNIRPDFSQLIATGREVKDGQSAEPECRQAGFARYRAEFIERATSGLARHPIAGRIRPPVLRDTHGIAEPLPRLSGRRSEIAIDPADVELLLAEAA